MSSNSRIHIKGIVLIRVLALQLCLLLVWHVSVVLSPGGSHVSAAEGESGGVRYVVSFEGIENAEMLKTLKLISRTEGRKDEPPPTEGLLRRRAEGDVREFIAALRSVGYYGASIETTIDESHDPVKVVFSVNTGRVYRIQSVEVQVQSEERETGGSMPTPAELSVAEGEPAHAQKILDAGDALVRRMKNRGYPFASADEPRVVVDHRTEGVAVTYLLDTGPAARFGDTSVTGLKSVEERVVLGKIPWKKGDLYDEALLADLQKRLTDLRLFSLSRVKRGEVLESDGTLPITVEVTERKQRTISAGASYKTDEGFGAKASWENRNLFGEGERLNASVIVSQISYGAEIAFEKADFLRDHQTLNARLGIGTDDTDAYESRNVESTVMVHREPGKGVKISAGPGFRFSEVEEEDNGWEEFALLSFPVQFEWDRSNDLLDPERGGRLKLHTTPYWSMLDIDTAFLKAYASYSHYWSLMKKPHLVLAARGALGSIVGAERRSVPADLRYYAGGGGSIRGYPYQSVSPLNAEEDPIGGRSLVEFSAELRWKITETVGFVTFLDGGGAFEPSFPDFSTSLKWGAGAGIRYYTPIGPLRLDVGVPLNRREGIDDVVQIYISLGQAF